MCTDGVAREVFALTGGELPPSLVPAAAPLGLKSKRRIVKRVRWRLVRFRNSARGDGALFRHWSRVDGGRRKGGGGAAQRATCGSAGGDGGGGEDEGADDDVEAEDYVFAKFNTRANVVWPWREADAPAVEEALRVSDAAIEARGGTAWTREETEQLFRLADRFDLRFPVIRDRLAPEPARTVEALKERYYGVAGALVKARAAAGETGEEGRAHAVHGFVYDFAGETERKAHYERLYKRSREDEVEEQHVLQETQRLQQTKRKLEKEARQAQRQAKKQQQRAVAADRKASSGGANRKASTATANVVVEYGADGKVLSKPAAPAVDLGPEPTAADFLGVDDARAAKRNADAYPPVGVSMRSAQMAVPLAVPQAIQARVDARLAHFGAEQPAMATLAIANKFDDIRWTIVDSLRLERRADDAAAEVRRLVAQLRDKFGVEPAPAAVSAGDSALGPPVSKKKRT